MLQIETVEPNAFSILTELMEMPELTDFSLVGGTALSLLYGHRKSVDLDLFSEKPFENSIVIDALKKKFHEKFIIEEKAPRFGVFGFIDNVKVDIIRHPHALIRPLQKIDNIRFFSTEDIMVMKIQAILGRGKKKDFWDIAELLNHYTLLISSRFTKKNILLKIY